MLTIRRADPGERSRLLDFYQAVGYRGSVGDTAVFFVAEEHAKVIGLLRVEEESGVAVLRGMRVIAGRQRQGIGTALLGAVAQHLGNRSCYCVPYAHLVGFYRQIGFSAVASVEAPAFLQERLAAYWVGRPDMIVMWRSGS